MSRMDGSGLPECVKALLRPYFPGFDLDAIRVCDGIPWYVLMQADAYTDRNRIHFAWGKYDPHSARGIALIGHEVTHSLQYSQLGTWRFRMRYVGSWASGLRRHRSLSRAYRENRYELEASEVQRMIYRDLREQFGADDPCGPKNFIGGDDCEC